MTYWTITDEFENVKETAIDSSDHNSDLLKEGKNMNLNAAANSDNEKTDLSVRTITIGELQRFRDDLYRFMETKESMISRFNEDTTISLMHGSDGFGWSIKVTLTGRHAEDRNVAKADCVEIPIDFRDSKSF